MLIRHTWIYIAGFVSAVSVNMSAHSVIRLLSALVLLSYAYGAISESKLCEHLLQMECTGKADISVCGSDGQLYQNSCFFGQAVCKGLDKTLRPVASENCPS
ncbi:uncharacterized protein LOC128190088 [Crassostrea angulata]|uniref:uncharacterized protein LOC128190088 n=1 Tax=Magallana angulata TaxID=2784310 RepID=UPI0005C36669|nr:uncharacterized protein LOC128190088 [Crassostrea angulata]|eukprot:XP_011442840.1 PREDICTED: uncharacterized protein LOC105339125 [Crassostrea gigas]